MLYDFFWCVFFFFAFICLVEFDTRLEDFYGRVDDAVPLQKNSRYWYFTLMFTPLSNYPLIPKFNKVLLHLKDRKGCWKSTVGCAFFMVSLFGGKGEGEGDSQQSVFSNVNFQDCFTLRAGRSRDTLTSACILVEVDLFLWWTAVYRKLNKIARAKFPPYYSSITAFMFGSCC